MSCGGRDGPWRVTHRGISRAPLRLILRELTEGPRRREIRHMTGDHRETPRRRPGAAGGGGALRDQSNRAAGARRMGARLRAAVAGSGSEPRVAVPGAPVALARPIIGV